MLGNSLASAGRPGVVLPRNGETYSLASRGTRRAGMSLTQRLNPLALWPPWDPQLPRPLDLERFHTWLISLKPRLSWVTLEELAELWKSPEPVAPEDLEVLRKAIAAQAVHYFVPEARRPFLLHLTPPENLPRSDRPAPRMSMEQATQIAEELLLADEDIRRYGFYPAEGVLRLEVSFPTAAAENWSSRFADFHRRTGWQIVLNNSTADTELEELARELLRESSLSQLEISHSENEVRTSLGNAESAHDLERVAARFFQRTGYRLVIAHRGESIT